MLIGSKEPNAFPLLGPRSIRTLGNVMLERNLWYTGVVEEVASGVEMAAMVGRNVAGLVVAQWRREGLHPPDSRRIPRPVEEEEGEQGQEAEAKEETEQEGNIQQEEMDEQKGSVQEQESEQEEAELKGVTEQEKPEEQVEEAELKAGAEKEEKAEQEEAELTVDSETESTQAVEEEGHADMQ